MSLLTVSTKKIQRRYPENSWDYKAISRIVVKSGVHPVDIVYYTLIDKGVASVGVEIYTGTNYILNATNKSYSRHYEISKVPKKYATIVHELSVEHMKATWSDAKRVDSN